MSTQQGDVLCCRFTLLNKSVWRKLCLHTRGDVLCLGAPSKINLYDKVRSTTHEDVFCNMCTLINKSVTCTLLKGESSLTIGWLNQLGDTKEYPLSRTLSWINYCAKAYFHTLEMGWYPMLYVHSSKINVTTPIRQGVVLCRMSSLANKLLKECVRRFIGRGTALEITWRDVKGIPNVHSHKLLYQCGHSRPQVRNILYQICTLLNKLFNHSLL